jgi:hypothetical protein
MVLFLAAFAFLFFWRTTVFTRIAAGVPLGFVITMCIWCIEDSWEQDGAWWFRALFQLLERRWDKFLEWIQRFVLFRPTTKTPESSAQV